MNLDGKVGVKLLILFIITMFSVTSVAHGTETSGNADGTVSCPDGKSEKGELSFSAFKKDAPIYGSWEVVVDKGSNGGYLDSGKIDKKIMIWEVKRQLAIFAVWTKKQIFQLMEIAEKERSRYELIRVGKEPLREILTVVKRVPWLLY